MFRSGGTRASPTPTLRGTSIGFLVATGYGATGYVQGLGGVQFIKLVSAELADELAEALPDREDLAEDAAILRQSADRCRDIMRSMGASGSPQAQGAAS